MMASRGLTGLIRGIIFVTFAVSTSFLGVVIFHPAVLLLWLLSSHGLYKFVADYIIGSWLTFCAGLVEYLLGIKPVVTGDTFQPGEHSLIIMNHATRLDWMFLWNVLIRTSGLNNLKIVLKDELKYLPGPGWAMQIAGFLFLRRKWDHDKTVFTDVLDYYKNTDYKCQLQLFPEGTDLNEWGVNSSNSYADKNRLPRYIHVLHPRVTGLSHLLHYAQQNGKPWDSVYDVTIAYPDSSPKSEAELVTGNIPEKVHFLIHQYKVSEVLGSSEDDTAEWCRRIWREKEKRLEVYYSTSKTFKEQVRAIDDNVSSSVMRNSIVAWTVFTVVAVFLLYYSWIIRLTAMFQVALSLITPCFCDGWHMVMAKTINYFYRKHISTNAS